MKKTLFLITLVFVCITNTFAQSDSIKWIVTLQYGLISEMPQHGSFVSFDVERKLKKKGYSIGFSFLKGKTTHQLDENSAMLFGGRMKDCPTDFEVVTFCFNKEINISKKNSFILGFGLSSISIQNTYARAEQYGQNKYYNYYSTYNFDLGLLANFQYSYQIRKNIGLGIQIKTLHSTMTFLEAIMVAPTLRFKVY